MSWVPSNIGSLAEQLTVAEATVLLGLFCVMTAALSLPFLKRKTERRYKRRDDEFRRLQNM